MLNNLPLSDVMRPMLPWPEVSVPTYDLMRHGRWQMRATPGQRIHGYWRSFLDIPGNFALQRREASKWRTWMSLTPMELESHQPHIAAATGRVVVTGLGMGMYLYNILAKEDVTEVWVIERDRQVIEMFEAVTGWKSWDGAHKLRIVEGDALNPPKVWGGEIDFLYADIWPSMGDSRALNDTTQMQNLIQAKRVGYWTQEYDFVSFLQSKGLSASAGPPSMGLWREFVASTGLPLIGEEWVTYPALAVLAVILQTTLYNHKGYDRLWEAGHMAALRFVADINSMHMEAARAEPGSTVYQLDQGGAAFVLRG